MATIKSVSTLVIDGDWIESKDQSPEGIRLIQTGNIGIGKYHDKANRAKYISEETLERLSCTELTAGDILISRLPDPIGRACIVPDNVGRAITAVDCTIIRLDSKKCDTEYFVQYTQSELYQNRLSQFFAGSTRTRISRKNLEQIEIPLPDISKQKQIASTLGKVDKLIALRKEQFAKLDQLVNARFIELSDEWMSEPEPLQSFLDDITYGFTNPMPDAEDGPWKITAKDVVNGAVNFSTARKTTTQAYEELTAKSKPVIGDVLLTKDGTLGRCAVVDVDGICVNQSVAVLKCNKRILPKFLAILLQMPEYQQEMMKNAGGGTIKHIYITKVVDMLIMVPAISQQLEFLSFVEQTDKSKLAIQQSLDKLELLKKSLMQEYFE